MRLLWQTCRPKRRREYRPIRVLDCLESRLLMTGVTDVVADSFFAADLPLGVIVNDQPTNGRIDDAQDRDIFVFNAQSDGIVVVQQTAAAVSGDVFPFDGVLQAFAEGSEFPIATDFGSFDTTIPRVVSFSVIAGQSYFVQVTGFAGSVGDYQLSLTEFADGSTSSDLGILTAVQPIEFTGQIDVPFERDVFEFQVAQPSTVIIEMSASAGSFLDTVLTLRDSYGTVIAFDDDSGVGLNSVLTATLEAGESYFIEAQGFGASIGGYSLRIRVADITQDLVADTPESLEPPVGVLLADQPTTGRIDSAQDRDVFAFTAQSDGIVVVQQTAVTVAEGTLPFDGVLQVLQEGSQFAIASDFGSFDTTIPRVVSFEVVAGARYFVRVMGFGGSIGDYQLSLTEFQQEGLRTDLGVLTETQPIEIAGSIDVPFERDQFEFQVTTPTTIVIELDSAEGSLLDPVVQLRNSSGTIVGFDDDSGAGLNSRLTVTLNAGETFLLETLGFANSTGSYILRVNILSTVADKRPDDRGQIGGNGQNQNGNENIVKPSVETVVNQLPINSRPFDDGQFNTQRTFGDLNPIGNSLSGDEGVQLDLSDGGLESQLLSFDSANSQFGNDLMDDFAFDGTDLFTVFELGRFEQQLAEFNSSEPSPDGLATRGSQSSIPWTWMAGLKSQQVRLFRSIDQLFSSPAASAQAKRLWQSLQPGQMDSQPNQSREDKTPPRPRESSGVQARPASNATERKVSRRTTASGGPHRPARNGEQTQATVEARFARFLEVQRTN